MLLYAPAPLTKIEVRLAANAYTAVCLKIISVLVRRNYLVYVPRKDPKKCAEGRVPKAALIYTKGVT